MEYKRKKRLVRVIKACRGIGWVIILLLFPITFPLVLSFLFPSEVDFESLEKAYYKDNNFIY